MAGTARGREAHGAGRNRLLHLALHFRHIVLGGLLAEGPLAHHVGAERRVADVARVVDALRQGVQHVHELGVGFPAPVDTSQHGVAGDVLGPLQVAEDEVHLFLAAGGQREAAIAHHHRGDAVIAGAAAHRVPEDLRVHVGVAVDEAGRHDMALGVYHLVRRLGDPADPRDAAVLDADVGPVAGQSGAVDHHAVLDHQIVSHAEVPPLE